MKNTLQVRIHPFVWCFLPQMYLSEDRGMLKFSFLIFTVEYRNKKYGY